MHAVLSTPELIDMILAHMPREANAITALVCRQWLEISRDHIWFDIHDPKELFSLLAPLKTNAETETPVCFPFRVISSILTSSIRSLRASRTKQIGRGSSPTHVAFVACYATAI